MRHIIYPILLFILIFKLCLLLSCSSTKTPNDNVRKYKEFTIPAPGVIWLKDSLLMDEAEVTNLQYLEYIDWIHRAEKTGEYLELLPDTNCWVNENVGDTQLINYYLRYPSYRDYPLVGVSYEKAIKFCEWRTDRVNFYFFTRDNKHFKWNMDSLYNVPIYVTYRLPTKEEWEQAAQCGLDENKYPFGYVNFWDKKNLPVTNTKEYFNQTKLFYLPKGSDKKPAPTENVVFGKRNRYGYFNMLGNVSEIVKDSLVMGLNFQTYLTGKPLYENGYDVSKTLPYTGSKSWIGFRCICEILPIVNYKKLKPYRGS